MKILLTGASSFTGAHFARALLDDGHEVWTTFTRDPMGYSPFQLERIQMFLGDTYNRWNAPFGSLEFLQLLAEERFDVACFHGARAGPGWSSETAFDVVSAVQQNTANLAETIHRLKQGGTRRVVLTETYAQAVRPTPSAYALSKRFTSELFDFQCRKYGVPLARFVVPNPFGPYEDDRFTSQAVRSWIQGEPVVVREAGIRDNIHVGLLARCYAQFVRWEESGKVLSVQNSGVEKGHKDADNERSPSLEPSGYAMPQPAFARLFAIKIGLRLKIKTPLDFWASASRGHGWWNNHPARDIVPGWDEEKAWDDLADYYRRFLPER